LLIYRGREQNNVLSQGDGNGVYVAKRVNSMDANDELRSEYDLSNLGGSIRGKYLPTNPTGTKSIQANSRWLALIGIVTLLLTLSWVTIAPGVPRVWAPLNLVVLAPAFLFYGLIHTTSFCLIIATLVVPAFFLVWTYPSAWLADVPPKRTVALAIASVVASAISLIFGYSKGIQYQGREYVDRVFIISSVCWIAILILAALSVRNRTRAWNVAFHVFLFSWLAWYAVPYMGELP
jgi:hypothetical protein